MDSTFPLVPTANFVACLLMLLSLSKNMFQSWNIGACSFAVWIAVLSFKVAINSIVWSNSIENIAPVWCDISEYCHSPNRQQVLTRHLNQQHILKLHQTELFLLHHLWLSGDCRSWFAGEMMWGLWEKWVDSSVQHDVFIIQALCRDSNFCSTSFFASGVLWSRWFCVG